MGLPTALLLAKAGYTIKGYDIDKTKIAILEQNKLPFEENGLITLFDQAKHNFHPSTHLEQSDVFIITVPTPLTNHKTCDLSYIKSATNSIKKVIQDNNLIILESTVPPGTTINNIKPILDKANKNYFLSYVSEKAIPGNTLYEMQHNHRIIGGINKESAELTKEIYSHFVQAPIHLTDTITAEAVKLMENTYRDVNIALANELALRLQKLNINAWKAITLANYHPRVNIHNPGPGVGGHCIAIDPWFLTENSTKLKIIPIARQINDSMPNNVLNIVRKTMKEIENATITVFGVAYKGDVDDARETPAINFIRLAEKEGYVVKVHDPYVEEFKYKIMSLEDAVKNSDCIILITDHSVFKNIDPLKIGNMMKTKNLVDTRNILDHKKWRKAGFTVEVLGKPSQ